MPDGREVIPLVVGVEVETEVLGGGTQVRRRRPGTAMSPPSYVAGSLGCG
ncbi:hypothetical protein BZL29_4378 [Mycobacterium kansasii]|uniref:Uncharacterized protein n=1 Tax=Mycobacterium kansasii TaxID=1768 RepID=A0A1V3X7Q0_MYCKA|nr:hypothetical protein BZL29_4378 [Mycobacterium kansasii]